ncbi:MAG TPA: nitroreductase family deazaflavin-dependent oxidoreductase [Pseudonocardia sp.]
MAFRSRFLWLIKNTLNRLTSRMAKAGVGPFALVRHVGRKSGKTYETPLILARVPEGFVAELTYGPTVNWYRNITAAGRCVVVVGGAEYQVDRIEAYETDAGLRAFGNPAAVLLRLLRRHEFRLLHTAEDPDGPHR